MFSSSRGLSILETSFDRQNWHDTIILALPSVKKTRGWQNTYFDVVWVNFEQKLKNWLSENLEREREKTQYHQILILKTCFYCLTRPRCRSSRRRDCTLPPFKQSPGGWGVGRRRLAGCPAPGRWTTECHGRPLRPPRDPRIHGGMQPAGGISWTWVSIA